MLVTPCNHVGVGSLVLNSAMSKLHNQYDATRTKQWVVGIKCSMVSITVSYVCSFWLHLRTHLLAISQSSKDTIL